MEKFKKITGVAAPLPMINVDTDMIIPKQFLKTIKRSGLGKNLFHELRYDLNGNIRNDFVLNWEHYRSSVILITGENFGCGSSREHAPWSLLDFGFRCIIAPSFADIFFNNCFKNGILPIKLDQKETNYLLKEAEKKKLVTVDLVNQKISSENSKLINFSVDSFRKKCLLEGLDDIALTLEKSEKIFNYEKKISKTKPWLIR
ncbi:MAG: 3-isopropylmalate dehydratase small subunit [Pseudomonadota bacterium]|nr:3-isopropylmalate dehydratase small subunit [Pseudomonadota bacterium]